MEEKINTFKDKNILVVGLARSGAGAANLLVELGAHVTVTDKKPESSLADVISRLTPSVKVVTGSNPPEVFDAADLIVISPGVPLTIAPLESAIAKGIPVISELELAYEIVMSDELRVMCKSAGPIPSPITRHPLPGFIGITGTNGKSTTTTLVDLMLKESGINTLLGGNIGIALTEEILKVIRVQGAEDSSQQSVVSSQGSGFNSSPITHHSLPDYIVAEISSFQLETIREFRPKIAAILNITPDHLDRYAGMQEYADAKVKVFENQTQEDFLILNADDPDLMKAVSEKLAIKSVKPIVLYFSRRKEVEGIYLKDGIIYSNSSHFQLPTSHFPLISQNEIKIQGVHNIENAMAACLISLLAGCSFEAIKNVMSTFPGLEHRLEYAGELRGVKFINDSKGTNVGAVAKSLEGLDNVILIMGGLDKGSDFSLLKDLVKQKVKALVLIGKAKDKIAEALGNVTDTHIAEDLRSAVGLSLSKASSGDVVLLSPGCASFDMFLDFEDRGRKFKEAVKELLP